MAEIQPNSTIYINNLPSTLQKSTLKTQLFFLLQSYGEIDSITCLKTERMRGQAWVAFQSVAVAAKVVKDEDATMFFGKAMRINFAKTVSKSTALRENPQLLYEAASTSKLTVSSAQREHQGKRALEDIAALSSSVGSKKPKLEVNAGAQAVDEDEEDVKMEEEDDQDESGKAS